DRIDGDARHAADSVFADDPAVDIDLLAAAVRKLNAQRRQAEEGARINERSLCSGDEPRFTQGKRRSVRTVDIAYQLQHDRIRSAVSRRINTSEQLHTNRVSGAYAGHAGIRRSRRRSGLRFVDAAEGFDL